MRKNVKMSSSLKRSSAPCDPLFQMFSLLRRQRQFQMKESQTKMPQPQARILPMRFLTVCKVAVIFDPHFERAQKERLPILTPTDDYENNDIFHKSDTPYREVLPILRLHRCRGMRHTETVDDALTGCVAHRNKQDICVPQMSEPTARAVGDLRGHPLTPGRKNEFKKEGMQ